MDEDDLVGGSVAIKLPLLGAGPASAEGDVGIGEKRYAAGEDIAAFGALGGFQVMMP